jgi:hypothetical protein
MLLRQLFMSNKSAAIITAVIIAVLGPPAFAQECRQSVDWRSLNLSTQQSMQVQSLEQDWNTKYLHLQPQILDLQRRLVRLLGDPKSDPLEIMSIQQTIARLKEQLRNEATANYLRKRSLLNEQQQRQLEFQLQQLVADRQRTALPGTQSDDNNGGFMNLIHKVRWAIDPH